MPNITTIHAITYTNRFYIAFDVGERNLNSAREKPGYEHLAERNSC